MGATSYESVLQAVEALPPEDQVRLAEVLNKRSTQAEVSPKRRSITELRGLGKEIWQGIDAQEYVKRERAAWDE